MTHSTLPLAPFMVIGDLDDGAPIRSIAPAAYSRTLQAHELYVQSGERAGNSFAGLKLRHIRPQCADLAGADFAGADLGRAILIGANLQCRRLAAADLSRGRLHGVKLSNADMSAVIFDAVGYLAVRSPTASMIWRG